MSQQVQPVQGQQFVAGSQSSGANPILSAVGPRFAIVPKIYPYAEGCNNPVLPQALNIVAVGDIQSPMHLKQVVNQVNSAQAPAPFTSMIPQSTCLCFNSMTSTILADQTVMDQGGSPSFAFKQVSRCALPEPCGHGNQCCRESFQSVVDPQGVQIGHLEWGSMTCGHCCAIAVCAMFCRTATEPEWAWFKGVDPHDRERLTFRHPAKEGECICCAWHRPAAYGNCCTTLPDMPWHEHNDLYGPMPEPGVIGAVDVRGAYGWDSFCCCKTFGVRPEMMATVSLTQNLSFEDTTIAIQMALARTQAQLEWRQPYDGQLHRLAFLKPGQVTMA